MTEATMEYRVDRDRTHLPETGIYVRAKGVRENGSEGWVSADIVHLDRTSLDAWLRSRGGDNPWAESVVALLLGHDVTSK